MIQIGPLSQVLARVSYTYIAFYRYLNWLCGRRYLSMVLFLIFYTYNIFDHLFLIFLLSISKYKKKLDMALFCFLYIFHDVVCSS